MKEIEIREIDVDSDEYPEVLSFRNKYLREPIGLNLFEEDLSDDAEDYIIIAKEGKHIRGCVMLHPKTTDLIKLRQMAIDEALRGKGLGKILVTNAEETALENGYRTIVLHARITARGFYEKLGYAAFGDIFTEVGIPHIAMQKELGEAL